MGLPKEVVVVLYIILCTIVGLIGRNKTIGFWGFFFFSMVLTPLVGFAVLAIARDKDRSLI